MDDRFSEDKELTQEEASKLSLTELVENINKRPKVIRVDDDNLNTHIENLIHDNSNQLNGEYSFYCIYQKPLGSMVRYALIHAFYLESEHLQYEDMDRIIMEDGKMMHQRLKESQLACDYFYVMPYFDFSDKSKGSILLNDRILKTNSLE